MVPRVRRTRFRLSFAFIVLTIACAAMGEEARREGAPSGRSLATQGRSELPDLRSYALKVVTLWVSHGDATLLLLPNGETALVDTGQDFAVKDYVLPFLAAHGVTTLDHLIVTHYHGDHCAGLIKEGKSMYLGYRYDASVPRVPVRHLYDYNSFHAGQSFGLGGANGFVLNSAYENASGGENEKSLSFRLEHRGFAVAFGADIYEDQQERILRDFPFHVPADVYRVNHHAHGSISERYLVATAPRLFITSAENAVYERTAYTGRLAGAVSALESKGRSVESLLTLEVGNVVVWANGKDDWGYGTSSPGAYVWSLDRKR